MCVCTCTCVHMHVNTYICACTCVHVCRGWLLAPAGSSNTRCLCFLEPHVISAHVCFSGNVRISDLGLAVELKEGQTKTKGYAGTPGKGLRAKVKVACPRGRGKALEVLGVTVAGEMTGEERGFVGELLPHPSE